MLTACTGGISGSRVAQLLQLTQRHLDAEVVELNLDAVMATVASAPVWSFQPLGYTVTGREAVRESYRRLIANFFPRLLPGGANHGKWFSESGLVTEDDIVLRLPDGSQLVAPVVSVLVFDGDLLASERVYFGSGSNSTWRTRSGLASPTCRESQCRSDHLAPRDSRTECSSVCEASFDRFAADPAGRTSPQERAGAAGAQPPRPEGERRKPLGSWGENQEPRPSREPPSAE